MARNELREIQDVQNSVKKIMAGQKYVVKVNENKRDLDAVNGTVQELAVFVATLVSDLKRQGILK